MSNRSDADDLDTKAYQIENSFEPGGLLFFIKMAQSCFDQGHVEGYRIWIKKASEVEAEIFQMRHLAKMLREAPQPRNSGDTYVMGPAPPGGFREDTPKDPDVFTTESGQKVRRVHKKLG